MEPEQTSPGELASKEIPGGSPSELHDRIPNYRLLQKIGSGGMGQVWQGEQEKPVRRIVAVKLIKAGLDIEQVVARFESERQALAMMNHPNIARVLDAGVTERGLPFFAMEYVPGEPITDYCDHHCLDIRARLELFIQVCDGVQHAHQKGIIHRDIKPTNVLVRVQDDKVIPKIIDFGVAKATDQRLTDKTMYTQIGALIGTLEYMSPEQAEMTGVNIDTRSDVYSLGVLLYELLVGRLPFHGQSFDEMRRQIREERPSKPSTRLTSLGESSRELAKQHGADPATLVRRLRGDLDWITMKALEKDRTRRYGSPAEFAADIVRHLRHEPVLAGPPSAVYRMRKWVQRHKVGAVAGSLVALTVLGGLAGTSYGLVRARRAEADARAEAASAAQVSGFLVDLFKVSDPGRARGNTITAREILDRGAAEVRDTLADQPLVHAKMLGTIGRVYLNLGLYPEARPLLEEAVQRRREVAGQHDPAIVGDLDSLGILLFRVGDVPEARSLFEQALEMREQRLPADHPEIAESLNNLGAVAQRDGDRERARSLFERALAIRERSLAPNDPDVAQSLSNLAMVLSGLGQHERSRRLHERSLEIRRTALGPDHHHVGDSMINLANVLIDLGETAEARTLFERALPILERSLGPEHARVANAENNLARLLKKVGDLPGARRHYERSLAINTRVFGPEHPATTFVLYNLARVAALEGRQFEALEQLRRCAEHGIAAQLRAQGYAAVADEPDLQALHGNPAFRKILSALAGPPAGT